MILTIQDARLSSTKLSVCLVLCVNPCVKGTVPAYFDRKLLKQHAVLASKHKPCKSNIQQLALSTLRKPFSSHAS